MLDNLSSKCSPQKCTMRTNLLVRFTILMQINRDYDFEFKSDRICGPYYSIRNIGVRVRQGRPPL